MPGPARKGPLEDLAADGHRVVRTDTQKCQARERRGGGSRWLSRSARWETLPLATGQENTGARGEQAGVNPEQSRSCGRGGGFVRQDYSRENVFHDPS